MAGTGTLGERVPEVPPVRVKDSSGGLKAEGKVELEVEGKGQRFKPMTRPRQGGTRCTGGTAILPNSLAAGGSNGGSVGLMRLEPGSPDPGRPWDFSLKATEGWEGLKRGQEWLRELRPRQRASRLGRV